MSRLPANPAPVDVLAVIADNAIALRNLGGNGIRRAVELEEARATVAELVSVARQIANDPSAKIEANDLLDLRAALAKFGGAK